MWQQTNFESIVPPSLDADSIASLLKSALGTTAAPRYVNGPITQPNKRVNVSDVTVALIGIGALAGEHRLLRFEGFSELDSVQKELFALRKLVTDTDPPAEGPGPFHHWVGDVCNSLFVVDRALDGSTLKPAIALRLKGLVQKLNEKMVLTTPTKLAQICQKGVVLAIAGGRHKAAAVAHVLAQRPPWITHLVIDEHVGRHLLQSRAS
ncbi:MAG TPA: hypothetical protein VHR66_25185 [Gemmataceae bacterium]|nr:hypothetical protein [Gemmataceae bacterium]